MLFCNKFNKFNNAGARILDSIYHMPLKIFQNCIFGMNTLKFSHYVRKVVMDITIYVK